MKIKQYFPLFYFILLLFITSIAWKYFIGPKLILLESQAGITPAEIKYDLFTDLINFLLTIIGISVAAIYLLIQHNVEKTIDKKIMQGEERIESLLRCSQKLVRCTDLEKSKENEIKSILMQSYSNTDIPTWLEEIIEQAKEALSYAKKLNKTKDETIILFAKNNLAYYLAIAKIREKEAKELIEKVYQKSGEYNNYHWMETYLWVCWRFAKNEEEKQKARKIFYELYKQKDMMCEREFKSKLEEYKQFFDKTPTNPTDHQK